MWPVCQCQHGLSNPWTSTGWCLLELTHLSLAERLLTAIAADHHCCCCQMHIAKNYLADQGSIPKNTKVPLILGVWGPKGCGKTFQVGLQLQNSPQGLGS